MTSDASFKAAFSSYRGIYLYILVFALVVFVESLYLKVPLSELQEVFRMLAAAFFKVAAFFVLFAGTVFLRILYQKKGGFREAAAEFRIVSLKYLQSTLFVNGITGSVLLAVLTTLFVISKCFVHHLLPYDWDPLFAEWEKWLHLGRYPHEYLVPFAEKYGWFPHLLDYAYISWLPVLTISTAYCLYCERDFQRRLQFLWTYVLAFSLLGGLLAHAFASTGPLFWRDFYDIPNPYDDLMAHLEAVNNEKKIVFYAGGPWMVQWTKDAAIISFNSIAAMPSLHNGAMLFLILYFRSVNRYVFWAFIALAALIFLATVYSGVHYAIDAYLAYVLVGLIWLLSHWIVRRFYPGAEGKRLSFE